MSGSFLIALRAAGQQTAVNLFRYEPAKGCGRAHRKRSLTDGTSPAPIPIAAGFSSPGGVPVRSSSLAHGNWWPRTDHRSARCDVLGHLFGRYRDKAADLNWIRPLKAAGRLTFFHRASTVRQDPRSDRSNQFHAAPFARASHEQNHATEHVGNVHFQVGAVRNVEC